MAAATSSMFPQAIKLVQMDDYGPMLEKLYTGNCSAAVVGRFDALRYIQVARRASDCIWCVLFEPE